MKGHFGTINAVAFEPTGRSFATGAEDGFVRLLHLDAEYDALGKEDDDKLDDATLASDLAAGALERLRKEEEDAASRAAADAEATRAAMDTRAAGGGAAGGAGSRR